MRGSWGRRGRRARRGRWRGRSEGQAGRHGVPRSPEGLFGLFTQYESIEEHEIHACTNIGVEATTAWIKTAASTQRAYYPSPAVSQGSVLVVQGRTAVFRAVRELSPVISTAAAGFHTSCLGGRAMGGVRRRDAVVVAPSYGGGTRFRFLPSAAPWTGIDGLRTRGGVSYGSLAHGEVRPIPLG